MSALTYDDKGDIVAQFLDALPDDDIVSGLAMTASAFAASIVAYEADLEMMIRLARIQHAQMKALVEAEKAKDASTERGHAH